MIRFSIIIPAFNSEKYIGRCLNSILKQNSTEYEVIVVNDGSEDDTLNEIKKFEESLNIKIINNNNQGVSCARNIGLDNSKGQYVIFIDSDDYILPGYLEYLNKLVANKEYDCIFLNYNLGVLGKIHERESCVFQISGDVSNEKTMEMFLEGKISNSPWDKVFNKRTLKEIRFCPGITVGEDALFCCQVLSESSENYIVDKSFYVYMQDTSGVTQRKFTAKKLNDISDVMIKIGKIIDLSVYKKKYHLMVFNQMVGYIFNRRFLSNILSNESLVFFDSLKHISINDIGTIKKKYAYIMSKMILMIKP
ncbi:Glycosyltransferase [Nitrincola lacisaponensis]|uniref:Glycosyltransferase n=1 Tax=Nitrincola lacisaponensis TaxID=267850 RepID=A0A063Y8R8_9GAMM|nr:glycosyltransferase family A protein [Nitrincola lacisaponensis]KDE41136.1 Glycosyltransferase [Nitrincola lacisaponensis]